jgi:hypothetical protein
VLLLLLPALMVALLQPLQCSQPPCCSAWFDSELHFMQLRVVGPAAAMAPPLFPAAAQHVHKVVVAVAALDKLHSY